MAARVASIPALVAAGLCLAGCVRPVRPVHVAPETCMQRVGRGEAMCGDAECKEALLGDIAYCRSQVPTTGYDHFNVTLDPYSCRIHASWSNARFPEWWNQCMVKLGWPWQDLK
jgi:hypothetical protein